MLPDLGPDLKIKKQGRSLWVKPADEIDVNLANLLSMNIGGQIGDNPAMPVVLNLAAVRYVNSTTIGMIAALIKRYRDRGLELYFMKPSKFVKQIFEQTGLDRVATICGSEKELPASCKAKKKRQSR